MSSRDNRIVYATGVGRIAQATATKPVPRGDGIVAALTQRGYTVKLAGG